MVDVRAVVVLLRAIGEVEDRKLLDAAAANRGQVLVAIEVHRAGWRPHRAGVERHRSPACLVGAGESPEQDRAGAVAHQVHLQTRMPRGQRLDFIQHQQQAAILLAGKHGVLLHLGPDGTSPRGSRYRFESVVQPVEHEVLRVVQKSFRPTTGDGVLEDVANRRPEIRSPDEREREDAGLEQRWPQVRHFLDGRVFRGEAAVRVEQQVLDRDRFIRVDPISRGG